MLALMGLFPLKPLSTSGTRWLMRLAWEQEQDFATWFELNMTAEAVFRVLASEHALILQENPFRTCVQTL